MPENRTAATRRIIGLALLASAALMALLALLFGVGAIVIAREARIIVAAALGFAALLEGLIGVRFLMSSSQ